MVPVFAVKHTPPTETQPLERVMPLANVEDAEAPVTLSAVVCTPPPKVEVPVPVTARFVVEALVSSVLPVSVEDAITAERLALN